MQSQRADLTWHAGGVPVSTRFDDPYFSVEDGLAETRYVFLNGNDLPARFRPGFHVAELGFGTGLNFLASWAAWRASGTLGRLHFTSFEAFPMHGADMERALEVFPEVAPLASALRDVWTGDALHHRFDDADLQIITGDARTTLAAWSGRADAWYLDGFSPAKNPELWGADLLADVARHTAPGGTAATYTAAGFVRRGLQDAGFVVSRQPGFGRKRHMTVAHLA